MAKALIKFAFKHVIDFDSQTEFETDVFNDSYSEFLMQSQIYNPEKKFNTIEKMIANNPKANSLHYKVGFAIGLYVKSLNNIILNLKDSLGITNIPFDKFQFHIISSDVTNKEMHKVAVIYRTDTMTLFDIIGENLVLANGDCTATHEEFASVFILKMQPELSIFQWADVVSGELSIVNESKNL
ncbi:MAG TPA: hypothetical protein VKT28_20665 [Puia sp.]|nr:hypothetical protein [Puia sp.]